MMVRIKRATRSAAIGAGIRSAPLIAGIAGLLLAICATLATAQDETGSPDGTPISSEAEAFGFSPTTVALLQDPGRAIDAGLAPEAADTAKAEVSAAFSTLLAEIHDRLVAAVSGPSVSFAPLPPDDDFRAMFLPTYREEDWYAWWISETIWSEEDAYDSENLKVSPHPTFQLNISCHLHPSEGALALAEAARAHAAAEAEKAGEPEESYLPAEIVSEVEIVGKPGVLMVADDPGSRFVELRWGPSPTDCHSAFLELIAPDHDGRAAHAIAVAERVDAILEEAGFYRFPPVFDAVQEVDIVEFLDANPVHSRDGQTLAGDWLPSDLIRAEILRDGTVADGVSQLILRAELDSADQRIVFSLPNPGDGAVVPLIGGETVTLQDRHYGFALYTPPEIFGGTGGGAGKAGEAAKDAAPETASVLEMRDVPLRLVIDDAPPVQQRFPLARPPVVLVHGLFSDPAQAWVAGFGGGTGMVAALEQAGFLPFLVNYQATNGFEVTGLTEGWFGIAKKDEFLPTGSSFQDNRRVVWDSPVTTYNPVPYEYGFFGAEAERPDLRVPGALRLGGISQALDFYREELNLAATQAIVIGHSMGGLLARVWASEHYNEAYRRPENFNAGDIDRLLTLNTPHFGSELMELKDALGAAEIEGEGYFAWARRLLANTVVWYFFEPEPDAMRDLRPGSRALRRIGATDVPAFAIATAATSAQIGSTETDPDQYYNMLFSAAGTIFFNNPALLDSFIANRFMRWRNTAAPYKQAGAKGQPPTVDLDDPGAVDAYRRTIHENIDRNAYYWAMRREADHVDELRDDLLRLVLYPFGTFETSMGNDFELRQLQPDYVASLVAAGGDYLRVFDEARESDVPETFIAILRDLVFHHDPDHDAVVRVDSQLGGLDIESRIDNVVHSYAPWDSRVQQKVIRLLTTDIGEFVDTGFPAAGQLTNRYLPSRSYSDATVEGDEAIAWSGMVASHAEQYLAYSDIGNTFILVRPVNSSSTGLLANNAAAKGMNIKGKSSSWGPQVGYIPVRQRYSKLWRTMRDPDKRRSEIATYDGKVAESLNGDFPGKPGRKYAIARSLEVCTGKGVCDVLADPDDSRDAEDSVVLKCGDDFFDWRNAERNGRPSFDPAAELRPVTLSAEERARLEASPLLVLADDSSDLEPRPYLTADYDLLAIGFPFENGICRDGGALTHPDPGACRPAPTPDVVSAGFDPMRGVISADQLGMLRVINAAVERNTGYAAGWVTHHGPENQYPGSPYVDYPILVFDPGGPGAGDARAYLVRQGPAGFRDIHLKRLFTEAARRGFNLWPNPQSNAWQWEARRPFDIRKGYDPRDAADMPPYVTEAPRPVPAAMAPPRCSPRDEAEADAVAETPEADPEDGSEDAALDALEDRIDAAIEECDITALRAVRTEVEAAQADAIGPDAERLAGFIARIDARLEPYLEVARGYRAGLAAYKAGDFDLARTEQARAASNAGALAGGERCERARAAVERLGRQIPNLEAFITLAEAMIVDCDIEAMEALLPKIEAKTTPVVQALVASLQAAVEQCQAPPLHPCHDPAIPVDGEMLAYARIYGGGHESWAVKGNLICFRDGYQEIAGATRINHACDSEAGTFVNCTETWRQDGEREALDGGAFKIVFEGGKSWIVIVPQ